MKKLALAFLFSASARRRQAADSAWVQAVASGYEARLVTGARRLSGAAHRQGRCGDGRARRRQRQISRWSAPRRSGAALTKAPASRGIGVAAAGGPIPQRILVLGDTGCRIKGAALQACNDPAAGLFPRSRRPPPD